MNYAVQMAQEYSFKQFQVQAVLDLLAKGDTVPFIARYRKEAHGSLDELQITNIRDRFAKLQEFTARQKAILDSLKERELLSPELEKAINNAKVLSDLEDIYLPYRPKKRTRASIAREQGLAPLADQIMLQNPAYLPEKLAEKYIQADKNIKTVAEALGGARDIIAETVNEDARMRKYMRSLFIKEAMLYAKIQKNKEAEGAKYQDYFDWKEPAFKAAGHRLLAVFRGENENFLAVSLLPAEDSALKLMQDLFIKNNSASAAELKLALTDSYKRLLAPAMQTELRNELRTKAELEAITVFTRNLRDLLLAPPLGQKAVMAIDPGFRTGCKVVCLDAQGKLLAHDLINILTEHELAKAAQTIDRLYKTHVPEAIAIGNGTAGRETESVMRSLKLKANIIMVSESGASVYSASELARAEFPNLDLTVRGAISIGRRLMDPLAELVKIPPQSIGVGQYQHDVTQKDLHLALQDIVLSCVNLVGVELNTASAELLASVSGLNMTIAKNIVAYREVHGAFKERKELLKVSRLGPKAFEQSAGFLRLHGGKNPLDASAVHPESYSLVEKMSKNLSCSVTDLLQKPDLRKAIKPEQYVTEKVGLPTITDILKELEKPGRDPRQSFSVFTFDERINSINNVQQGMKLPGIVTNITNFGAFVDIGAHQDGLVHISQISDSFIKDPHAVLSVGQQVQATVLEIDLPRKRISLSLKTGA